jgi:hypothetical protein
MIRSVEANDARGRAIPTHVGTAALGCPVEQSSTAPLPPSMNLEFSIR